MLQKSYAEIFQHMPPKDLSLLGDESDVQAALGTMTVHVIPAVAFTAEVVAPHIGAINFANWMAVPHGILPKKVLDVAKAVAAAQISTDRDKAITQAARKHKLPVVGPNRFSEFDIELTRAAWRTGIEIFRADLKPKELGNAPNSTQEVRERIMNSGSYGNAVDIVKRWLEERSQFADNRDMTIARAVIQAAIERANQSAKIHHLSSANDGILTLLPSTMSALYILRQAGLPSDRITPSTVEQIKASYEETDESQGDEVLGDEVEDDVKRLHGLGLWAVDDLIPDPITRGQAKLQAGQELTEEDTAQTLFALVAYGNIIGETYRDFPNNWPASLHNACNFVLAQAQATDIEGLFDQTICVLSDRRVLDFTNMYIDLVNAYANELEIDMSPEPDQEQ